jgi:penicillin-binding protein 1C
MNKYLVIGMVVFFFPPPAVLPDPIAPPPRSIRIYDRNGLPLRTFLSTDQTLSYPVSLDSISPWLVVATVAAEDKRFFLHPGVDLDASLRALWQNTRAGHVVSGASTLTEQLVRSLNPVPRSLWGKIRESFDALSLESKADKREILEGYFNHVSYGNLCVGVEAASQSYFGVPAGDLSLAQAAVLAGIPKSPNHYDPYHHPGEALKRQRHILDLLEQRGWVDKQTAEWAREEKIIFKRTKPEFIAPHFTRYLAETAPAGAARLDSTLDRALQQDLQSLLKSDLTRVAAHHVTNGALLVLDNRTGEVLAWVGSADFFNAQIQGQVDGVLALRQPGSSLKPFAYGLAFSRGFKPSDILLDEPLFTENGFMPKNYDESYHGPVRMRTALACSFNVPAMRIVEKLTVPAFLNTLHDFGFQSLKGTAGKYGDALVLGDGEVTMLELADAYATLARGGVWIPVRTLMGGPGVDARRALDRESCFQVTSILSDNNARMEAFGLSSPLLEPFPFAAKTGTTKDYRDNWAVGYTPEWTVAVWVGNFNGDPMRHVSGITGAAPILHDAALTVEKMYPSTDFPRPVGIQEVDICPDSGKLPGPFCPNRRAEFFKKGNLPTQVCDVHKAMARKAPPDRPKRLRIKFPQDGDIFKIDPQAAKGSQGLHLTTNGGPDSEMAVWQVDGKSIEAKGDDAWWMLRPGWHEAVLGLLEDGKFVKKNSVSFRVLR